MTRTAPLSLRALALGLAALVGLQPAEAGAGGTRSFRVADFDDFDSGEAEGAAIEVELADAVVRVVPGVDDGLLTAVLRAVRASAA